MTTHPYFNSRISQVALAAAILCLTPFQVSALPVGGVVSTGSANISTNNAMTSIHQSTQKAVINWQTFSIAAGEHVQVFQPNASSVLLNRISGTQASQIFGSLSANGQVFLINPNGLLFAKGSSVNTSGLVASTLNLSDSDFVAGRFQFAGTSSAAVVNQGNLISEGGYVALVGAHVDNQGTIQTRAGTASLVAGNAMSLEVLSDGLLNIHISEGALNALALNGGLIQADGGKILLTAKSASELIPSVINTMGVLQAHALENRSGIISLVAGGTNGTVNVGGTLDVTGTSVGQKGGRIELTGPQVGLIDATLLASGHEGGGNVFVGGALVDSNLQNNFTRATYMNGASEIHADALSVGNGGTVIVKAIDSTRAHGKISAQGGALGGNGGLIETSADHLSVANLRVNASAPKGQIGTWLLDPADVTISSAATTHEAITSNVYAPLTGESVANINVGELVVALNLANVVVTTTNTSVSGTGTGNIHVNDVLTWTAPTSLSLNAANDVTINQAVTATNGTFKVNAGNDIKVLAAVTTTTGSLEFTAARDLFLSAATTITTGHLNAIAGGNVNMSAASTITGGNMLLRADNDGTGPGASGGTVNITCLPNCITLTNGTLTIRFNPVSEATLPAELTAYDGKLTGAAHTLDAKAWMFAKGVDKAYDGNTTASLVLAGGRSDATLSAGTANFTSKDVASQRSIEFSGYTTSGIGANHLLWSPVGVASGSGTTSANITAVPLTIRATTPLNKAFGETLSLTGFTVVGLQNGDTVTSINETSLGAESSASVAGGPYAIVGSGAAGSFVPSNYNISYVNGTLTVLPVPLSITANGASKTYGQTLSLPVTGFVSSGLVNGDAISSVVKTSSATVATAPVSGSPYPIVPSAAEGTFVPGNYTISYVNGALLVTPANLTVTANAASKTYGQTLVLSPQAFTSSGLVNGDTITGVVKTSAGTVATAPVLGSPYAIVPSAAEGTLVPGNYSISYVNGALTVTPANLIITSNDVVKNYGEAIALSTTAFSTQGLVNDDQIHAVLPTSVGQLATALPGTSYPIVLGQATGSEFVPSNYSIAYVNGALTVIALPEVLPPFNPTPQPFVNQEFPPVGDKAGLTSTPPLLANPPELSSLIPERPINQPTMKEPVIVILPIEPTTQTIKPVVPTGPVLKDEPPLPIKPILVRPRKQDRN